MSTYFDGETGGAKQVGREVDETLREREETLFNHFDDLKQTAPDPLAPVAEQLAHTLAMIRLREEAEQLQRDQKTG